MESTLCLSANHLRGQGLDQTRAAPEEWDDIELGFRIAKEIGRLGIGQTVVVKNQVVVAVEAVEGTDAAIKRGGALAKSGCVVVKVSKPQQDLRFDVPAVGSTPSFCCTSAAATFWRGSRQDDLAGERKPYWATPTLMGSRRRRQRRFITH